MRYSLSFWRYKPDAKLDDQAVNEALSDGREVHGVEPLPIDKMTKRVQAVFGKEWKQVNPTTWESPQGAFLVFTTPQFFRVDCYEMDGDDMNKFIDIAEEFDCPLYDPQAGERFTD